MRRYLPLALALCLFVMPAAAQPDPAPLTAEDVFALNVEFRYIQPEVPAEPAPTVTSFVSPCPGVGTIEEAPYFEWWFIGENGGTLCHVLTGERSSPPTEGDVSFEHQYDRTRGLDRVFTLSADKRFLVFSGRLSQPVEVDQKLHNFALYAYDVVDGVFRRLGTIPYLQRSEEITWNGSKLVFLLADGIDSQAEKRIYLADAILEESNELLFETYLQIEYYDNPPRIETLPYIGGGGIVCGKHVYDLMTKQMTTYDYGQTLCRPDYGSFEGVGYFREIIRREDGSSIAQVARVDGRTGQQIRMWTGEIERVLWVAEDNSLGILLIDNDGRIAVHPDVADYFTVLMRVPVSVLTQYPAVEPLATSVVYPRVGYSPPTIWTET